MRIKGKPKYNTWADEKKLRKVALLLNENYRVSEKELEECKQIIENFQECTQSSSK